jgi:hypothetical protein
MWEQRPELAPQGSQKEATVVWVWVESKERKKEHHISSEGAELLEGI